MVGMSWREIYRYTSRMVKSTVRMDLQRSILELGISRGLRMAEDIELVGQQ
jgi:hypothetical protein